jgi:hypothetical protein
MPHVAVITHVPPIAIIIQIINARNVVVDVIVTGVEMRRIVVIGIVEVCVVIAIASVVVLRIASPIVVVDDVAGLVRLYFRDGGWLAAPVAGHRQVLTLLNFS